MTRRLATLTTAAAATLGLAACGSSDPAPTTSSAAASTPAATTTAAAAAPATPAAVAATGGKVTVATTEYAFAPTAITAKAGKLKLTLQNKGAIQHELVLLKSDAAPASLKVGSGQRVSEDASVGEVSETDAGKSASHTFDLKPGKYVYVCNIPAHYGLGMRGELTVK